MRHYVLFLGQGQGEVGAFTDLVKAGGPIVVAVAVLCILIVILFKYVAKPAIDGFVAISLNSSAAAANNVRAAEANVAAATRNEACASLNNTTAERLERVMQMAEQRALLNLSQGGARP